MLRENAPEVIMGRNPNLKFLVKSIEDHQCQVTFCGDEQTGRTPDLLSRGYSLIYIVNRNDG